MTLEKSKLQSLIASYKVLLKSLKSFDNSDQSYIQVWMQNLKFEFWMDSNVGGLPFIWMFYDLVQIKVFDMIIR